jgi:hypothetical protein
MDTVLLSLGLAIVVVLVLLMSCWKSKPKRRRAVRAGNCTPTVSNAAASEPDPSAFYSSYGTGPMNRQMSKQYANLQNLKGYQDWNEVAQYQSLEPSVFESQEEYAQDINRSTSSASSSTIRSDDAYPIDWTGLRRPEMQSCYSGNDSRVVSSQSPDQMPSATRFLI